MADQFTTSILHVEMPDSFKVIPSCANCHKTVEELQKPLSKCSKCTAKYCSRDCQKNDWNNNNHRAQCAPKSNSKKSKPASAATGQHNPGFYAAQKFLGLENNDYLHKLPEKQVFGELIDCFRLRMADEYKFMGEGHGIYNMKSPLPVFRDFLNLAEKRDGFLPEWWNEEKRTLCEKMSVEDEWYNIHRKVEKLEIVAHYNNSTKPMTLRVLGEKVYGKGVM